MVTTRSSLLVEQLGHRLLMRDRSGTPCRYPLPVSRQRGFDVSFLQKLWRSMPLHRLELPQLPERNDRGRLTTQVDHLVAARVTGWGCGHGNTVPRSCDIHSREARPSTGSFSINAR
jgi:hypothetical protein